MRRTFIAILSIVGLQLAAQSLEEQVLFTVEDDTVTAGEYMAVYNKNRGLGEDIDPKTPSEYLELYINFKLKVHEAKEMGMDTAEAFLREYNSYRGQLAKPYLTDKDVTEDLVKEAYERMKYDVRASHIMVKLGPNASPEDTLAAYNKIMNIKQKLDGGADFAQTAGEYSDDGYSAKRGGDLGYFTVFNMVYPFESEAYKNDIGVMSGPIRSRYGYHIVKTTDRRPARGQITVSHLMLVSNSQSTPEQKENASLKIQEIYEQLKNGADWNTMVRQYSEDEPSVPQGGMLPPFGINKMFDEFEDAAFALENVGDMTRPVLTPVGWHIIRLESKSGIPAWEDVQGELKQRVEQDDRSQQSQISIIKKLKKSYQFKEYPEVREMAFKQVDDSYLQGSFSLEGKKNLDKVLFEFTGNQYTVGNFYDHLARQRGRKQGSMYQELRRAYESYVDGRLIAYEDSRLEEKYPEFRLLSREYFEGILLFDLTEDKVWRRSVSDTTGLKQYYNDHKNDYQWGFRYKAITANASSKKVIKSVVKKLKMSENIADIQREINEESQLTVALDSGVYEIDDKPILNEVELAEPGISKVVEKDDRFNVVQILEVIPPTNKTFKESRGLVISDYQSYLEKEWIEELKAKYKVRTDQKTLAEVIKVLESES